MDRRSACVQTVPVLLTLSTTHRPATDLGYLLHKHPDRVQQFPQSRYAADAKARMDYIVNSLAEYELHVARYYYRRNAFVAASNRAQQVLVEFPQTPATEEALFIMVASYDQLGLEQLKGDAQRVLEKNFPSSRYLREGTVRQRDRAWWQFW